MPERAAQGTEFLFLLLAIAAAELQWQKHQLETSEFFKRLKLLRNAAAHYSSHCHWLI